MSSPLPKPVRRGTLNLGLRRKSSVASLTPSINESNGAEDAADDDNASIISKSDKRPPKKRMFSLLAPRASKSPFSDTNGNGSVLTQEKSESSEYDPTLNGSTTGSVGSGFFSAQKRLSGSSKVAAEAERKRLEELIQTLASEKSTLEASLQSATSETERLAAEAVKNAASWEAERSKIQEDGAVRLLEKEGEVKSLSGTVAQLREELAKAKAAEEELATFKAKSASDLEAKLAEQEERVRATVDQEKESLEIKLTSAQTTLDAKDGIIKGLETEVTGLKEKMATLEEEAKKLKESSEALLKKESGGGCTIM